MAEGAASKWRQGVTWAIAIVCSGLGGAVLNNVVASRSTIVEYSINRTAVGADQAAVIPDFRVGDTSLRSLYIYTIKLNYASGPELESAKVGIDLGTLNVKALGKIVPDGPGPLFAVACEPFVAAIKSVATFCSVGRLSPNVGTYAISFATDTDANVGISIDAKNTHLKPSGEPETARANLWLIESFFTLLATVVGYYFGSRSGSNSEQITALKDAVALATQPMLEIDYEGAEGNKVEAHYKNKDQLDIDDIYIRVRVRNVGRGTAIGARVFLTCLQEVQNSRPARVRVFDSLQLPWAGWALEPRDIPSGVSFYADLMRISKHTPGWIFSAKMFASDAGLAKYAGTYRFEVKATADNAATAVCKVDVTYGQDWHTLRAVAVPKTDVDSI